MKTGAMENGKMLKNKVYEGNCLDILPRIQDKIDLTFLDPLLIKIKIINFIMIICPMRNIGI